jgi:hypothetical protein
MITVYSVHDIDDDMIERGAAAIYEMTRGAQLPGVLNGVRVSHVGGRQLAEAVLRASLGEDIVERDVLSDDVIVNGHRITSAMWMVEARKVETEGPWPPSIAGKIAWSRLVARAQLGTL